MQRLCVSCSHSSVCVELASSSRAAMPASAKGTAGHPRKCPVLHHLPRILYVWHLFSPCKLYTGTGTSCSPDRRNFAGPWVTSVGGTKLCTQLRGGWRSQIASPGAASRHSFCALQSRPSDYQKHRDVTTFLRETRHGYAGLYKCVRSRGLTQPILTM
jgi:hypothetical protein